MKKITLLIFLILIISCKKNTNVDVAENFNFNTKIRERIDSTQISKFINTNKDFKIIESDIKSFYKDRDYKFAWFDEDDIIEQAFQLNNKLHLTYKDNHLENPPYFKDLQNIFDEEVNNKNADYVDIMLTAQYIYYGNKYYQGDLSKKELKNINWLINRKKLNVSDYLSSKLDKELALFEDEPIADDYLLLKKQLNILHTKGLDTVTALKFNEKSLKLGDSATVISKVRNRLFLMGDLSKNNKSNTFDEELQLGVKNFQKRHGLTQDGAIGQGFMQEFNVSGKERINQIIINLERYRWLPYYKNSEYLFVNIPEFKLHAYKGDSLQWSMDIIVGKSLHKTVIFNGSISYIVFSPYWNIPRGILERKIIPAMNANENYLAQNNMEIIGYNGSLPIVRQKPGKNNSLGLVKFMFPNSHAIYLHDTPQKELFNETSRTFSSGCVRVKNPQFLAKYLLKNQKEWTSESIKKAMNSGNEQRVDIQQPMPVYLVYLTSFVDKQGKLNFRKDVYNRDKKLKNIILE